MTVPAGDHMRWDTRLVTLFGTKLHFFKVIDFFHAHVCGCHITVNHTFFMILDARETPAQRRFNAPKIIENPSASSEPRADKEHHVEGIFKSGKFISFYRNPCYKKNGLPVL